MAVAKLVTTKVDSFVPSVLVLSQLARLLLGHRLLSSVTEYLLALNVFVPGSFGRLEHIPGTVLEPLGLVLPNKVTVQMSPPQLDSVLEPTVFVGQAILPWLCGQTAR